MGFHNLNSIICHELNDALELPRFRSPRVLVDELPAISQLMAVEQHAEVDVTLRLLEFPLEPSQPFAVIPMNVLV